MLNAVSEQSAVKTERYLIRHEWRWVSVFILGLLALALAVDLHQKMWLDELYTFHTASQANVTEVVRGTMEGMDGMPPAYSIIVNLLLYSRVMPAELAVRLPSTVAYCLMTLFIYAFCRRRFSLLYAMGATAWACFLNIYYVSEGRSYGVALCCVAGALYFWQLAAEGKWRAWSIGFLAFFLAAMTAMQYYAVFVTLPLLIGEMIRAFKRRKLDIPILLTALAPLLVLAVHYPLIQTAKRMQAHYWAIARWSNIPEFYADQFFKVLPLLIALAYWLIFGRKKRSSNSHGDRLRADEWVVLAGLALLPVVVGVASMFTTHVFVARYICWSLIGCALLFAAIVQTFSEANTRTGWALLIAALFLCGVHEIYSLVKPQQIDMYVTRLDKLPDSTEPIVTDDARKFMELAYYATPKIRQRLLYPISWELEMKYRHYDTNTLLFESLRPRTKLGFVAHTELRAKFPRFIVLATNPSYLPKQLLSEGYNLKEMLPAQDNLRLFVVESGAPGTANTGLRIIAERFEVPTRSSSA
jgi:hypothetical protein